MRPGKRYWVIENILFYSDNVLQIEKCGRNFMRANPDIQRHALRFMTDNCDHLMDHIDSGKVYNNNQHGQQ